MRILLSIGLLPLAVLFGRHTGNPVLFTEPDTVKVTTAGASNLVVIDSLRFYETANDTFLINSLQGEIIQTGQNNKVTISTKNQQANNKQTPNHKLERSIDTATAGNQKASKFQKTKNKQEISKSKNQITIKQTGKNNSVKINRK